MGERSRRLLLLCFPSALQMDSPTQTETRDPKGLWSTGTTGGHVSSKKISQAQNGACLASTGTGNLPKIPLILPQRFATAMLTPDSAAGPGPIPPDCRGNITGVYVRQTKISQLQNGACFAPKKV